MCSKKVRCCTLHSANHIGAWADAALTTKRTSDATKQLYPSQCPLRQAFTGGTLANMHMHSLYHRCKLVSAGHKFSALHADVKGPAV